ncbi:MAG: hypothetical protein L6R38_006966 [Xanthoria sp. 2 TBL-2021]|nr:MAG: hypothetical protein L6R38_006966 [Xanthoria sp. 2 TBL-2021]
MATDPSRPKPRYLNVTAISAKNGASTIECWRLAAPFKASSEAGVSGASFAQLGKAGSASYALIPAKFGGGLYNAPTVQYVAFLSGTAVVSVPDSRRSVTIKGGRDGLIIAVDTADVSKLGYNTKYPSEEQTIGIQIPTADGKVPAHTVLYLGPCKKEYSL